MRHCPHVLSLLVLLLVGSASAAQAEQPAWVFSGPPDVGTVFDLKAADGVVYAATTAGVYRSTASGQGWELSGPRNESVRAIAVEPGSPVYALVGDGGGLLVSRDAGDSWIRLAASDSRLSTIAVDPAEPSTAYLANQDGVVWKTTDSGATWKRVSGAELRYVTAIGFDPHDNALMILGVGPFNSATVVRRSTDGGTTFTTVTITGYANSQWFAIGSGAPGSSRFYASIPGFVCRTADGAATWTCSSVGTNVWRIVEVPASTVSATPVVLAVSDQGLLVSGDGGATWAQAAEPLSTTFLLAAAFDPASGAVFAGTDAGIFRSTDRGTTWSWHGQGLRSSWISALAVDPVDPSKLVASSSGFTPDQGPGLFRSGDAGQIWSSLGSESAPSGFNALAFEASNSSILYGVASGTFYRSENAGQSWTASQASNYHFNNLLSDPRSPGRVWAGDYSGLARSDDGGAHWERAGITQQVYSLVLDRHDPATFYAGSNYDISYGYYAYPEGGSIFVSRDFGATWAKGAPDLGAAPVALETDPFAGGVVYAGTAGAGVLRSADGGRTWVGSPDESPRVVSDLVADPSRPGILYAAADGSVYRSLDGGKSWQLFDNGLDGPPVLALEIAGGGRRLVAATNGAGIYQIDLGVVGPSFPCVADAEHLCLVGGRYSLEVTVQGRNQWSAGAAHSLTDRAGYFGFPAVTGDAGFPEVVVKMLPEGALGPGGPAIFHSSLTTLPYALTLTDTTTGKQHIYTGNGSGVRCGGTDRPFPDASAAISRPEAEAQPADAALSLLDHRFTVTLKARNPRNGRESNGLAVGGDDRWGYFSMPDVTGDPALPEVVVKMVDFRAISGKFWVFLTGLTDFDYTLTVTDSQTGAAQTYQSTEAFCGSADTAAFSD